MISYTVSWNSYSSWSPSATYRPVMWSVGCRNGDMKGLYYITIFDNAALWKCLMLIKPAFIWSKIQKNCNIVKYYNLKERFSILMYFKISFIPVIQSWIFSIITPAFSAWSFRNHSNTLIYYQCWKQLCCLIFCFYFNFIYLFWNRDNCLGFIDK